MYTDSSTYSFSNRELSPTNSESSQKINSSESNRSHAMFVICYAESVHCTMTELRVWNILKQDGDDYFIPIDIAQGLVLIS